MVEGDRGHDPAPASRRQRTAPSLADPWVTRIWPATLGTPTDLMLSRTASTRRRARSHAPGGPGSCAIMLCAATSARTTALPQCSRARNSYPYSACGNRATSPADEHVVDHHPIDVESAAAGITATPSGPAASPEPASHSVLRSAPEGNHRHVDLDRGAVRQRARRGTGRRCPSSASTVTLQRRSTPASRCMPRRHLAHHPAERPHQRRVGRVRPRSPRCPACGTPRRPPTR